jgi:transcriptional regulator with XRE-family HTH domain
VAASGIAFYRGRKGLKQAELATALGLAGPQMSDMENGSRIPTPEQVDKLVELLEVPPTYLFSKHVLAEVAERSRAEAAT